MHKEFARRDQERKDKAEKIDYWDGGVFWASNYYPSVEEAAEAIWDHTTEEDVPPQYLFIAKQVTARQLRACDIIEGYYGDLEDDGYDHIEGIEELERACQEFNKKNKDIQWFTEDRKRMAKIPKMEAIP
jgi:hypothetical protein